MDLYSIAFMISGSVAVMVAGAVIGGILIKSPGVLRIVVMPVTALIAAAMMPASVNAITPNDGYNVAVYIIAAVAMYAILWRPAVWVVADGYPAIEWPRIPKPSLSYTKRRDNRYDLKEDPEYQRIYRERIKEYGSK